MGTSVPSSINQPFPNTSFNTKYQVNFSQLTTLKTLLCDQSFLDRLSLLFRSPSDFINGIKYYPFSFDLIGRLSASQELYLGGRIETGIEAKQVVSIYNNVKIADIEIRREYNNFLDYEPYTKVELFVPYFSFIELPTNEVMGKTVSLYLSVDFDTGIGTLYVQIEGRVIMVTTAKLGIDIPLGSTNYNEVIKDVINNSIKGGIGVVASIASENFAGALAIGVKTASQNIFGSTKRYSRGTLSGGSGMLASPTSIYAVITRPNSLMTDAQLEKYSKVKGRPLEATLVLSQLHGFTIVGEVHLNDMPNALDEEMKEIETLLKKGVEL